jgi:arginyl-tRNA synthetase
LADPIEVLENILRPAFNAANDRLGGTTAPGGIDPVVRASEHADAQANGALALAKHLGRPPREVAQAVIDHLGETGDLDQICEHVEIAGPGFINLSLRNEFLGVALSGLVQDGRLGVAEVSERRTVVIDYSAPNVAKEMHVGHLRSTVIGDALARMLEFVGHSVIRENHIGDWGRPFGMLIEHLVDIGADAASAGLSQGDLDGFYKAANAKFDTSEEFQERSRARVVALQSGDLETGALWERLVKMSTDYFNTVYERLGVLLDDGDLMGESRYQSLMATTIDRLDAAGLLVESDGAKVVFPPGFRNRDGEPLPLIIQARTGGFNYATSDLSCVIDRVERLGADLLLYVVGAPQRQHLEMVFEVARLAGWLTPPAEAIHVSFGNVLGADRKMLRSRSGDAVKLVDLLAESVERAGAAVADKNPDLDTAQRSEVAQMIGIGSVKYADLSTDRIRDYVFDWERMLSFDGNTAPYLQYAHARICSIFRRADLDRGEFRTHWPERDHTAVGLAEQAERTLAKRLLAYPTTISSATQQYAPHTICTYLFELSQDFTAFYEHCPVLKADEPTRSDRLMLCDLTARTLQHGLGLLGIDVPEQM